MNHKNLQIIFNKYIDDFERINNSEHRENYKWEVAQAFQSFDLQAQDLVGELMRLWKFSSNLIDSVHRLPFYAIIEYAKLEPETVRQMFLDLYAKDNGNLVERQSKISAFLSGSEALRTKYFPESHLYENDQRSVMQFLSFYNPNENYLYKAVQAKKFAECIEFYDDWGTMNRFRLDVYYRMCDMLVEEIRKCPELLETHQRRYTEYDLDLHPDENLHILAFDIIYTSQVYAFYDGMTFSPITAQRRKERQILTEQARIRFRELEQAKLRYQMLQDATEYFQSVFTVGRTVRHKIFGIGTITEMSGTNLTVKFPNRDKTLNLGLLNSIAQKFLTVNDMDLSEQIEKYKTVMRKESEIRRALLEAEKGYLLYAEFLE